MDNGNSGANEFNQQYNAQKQNSNRSGTKKLWDWGKALLALLAVLVVLVLLSNTFLFMVNEKEQVVVTQFDRIVRIIVDDVNDPSIANIKSNPQYAGVKIEEGKGIHFKIPFVQKVIYYTNQYLTYETSADEVFTRDKKTILLDNFAQWKIHNPVFFMASMGSRENAHYRIDEFIYSKMREEIGKIDAHVLIADKDYMMSMLQEVEDYVNSQMEPMGIQVLDIRIMRTEFPDETKPSIYEQMRSERQAVATKYRADGQKQSRTILSEAQKNATVIEAQAYEQAQKLRGEGDAEAARIYAEAYNVDPEFYEFWKTLQTYSAVIGEDTTIIINPSSQFAKFIYSK